MLSAPSTIANSTAITLRPALAAPGRSRRSRTSRPASASIPSRCASVATSAIPASETTRSSSNSTRTPVQSDRPVILHHEGDLLTQDATALIDRFLPAQEVILRSQTGRNRRYPSGGSRLSYRPAARRPS